MEKIGFFGGSFNPPTIAHLKIVEFSLKEFGLDKVVIVPMGDKYEKSELISFNNRFNMLQRIFENNDRVEISRMQENQKQKSYAIDCFEKIDNKYKASENFFIMGLDNYNNISNWKDAEKLLENYKYIVFKRGNNKVQKNNQNTYFVNSFYNISSSDVRKKIKNNRNLEQFITKDVIKFINENNLYK